MENPAPTGITPPDIRTISSNIIPERQTTRDKPPSGQTGINPHVRTPRLAGEDAVAHRLGDALPEALLQGAVDVLAGGAGALGDGTQDLPEGGLVEGVGTSGLGGELRHLLDAGLVGLAALEMGALQEASLLSAVVACAGKGLEEMGMVLLSF